MKRVRITESLQGLIPYHLKNLPTMLPASLPANPDPKAPFANVDASENLFARLKATEFVIVRANAMAVVCTLIS
jgi:hypothetical protein